MSRQLKIGKFKSRINGWRQLLMLVSLYLTLAAFSGQAFSFLHHSVEQSTLAFAQVNRLSAGDGVGGDRFGHALAMTDEFLVVGAFKADILGLPEQGAAYIYQRSAATPHIWLFRKKIVAPDGQARDNFGISVAISGETILIGAQAADLTSGNPLDTDHGAAYIYSRHQGGSDNWGFVKKLTASDFETGANFGWSVALDGSTAAIGAFLDNSEGDKDRGAVYLFSQNSGGANSWGQTNKIVANDGMAGDYFGFVVAVAGETVVVGAKLADIAPFQDQGAAYIFEKNSGGTNGWGQVKKLTAADGLQRDLFGAAVALEGDIIAVGAYWADHMFKADQGAVYLFGRHEGGSQNWGSLAKIQLPSGEAGDHFGRHLTLADGSLLVSAPEAEPASGAGDGLAYRFQENGGQWTLTDTLNPTEGPTPIDFGSSVAQNGNIIFIGADGSGSVTDPGQTLLFSEISDDMTIRLYLPLSKRP